MVDRTQKIEYSGQNMTSGGSRQRRADKTWKTVQSRQGIKDREWQAVDGR